MYLAYKKLPAMTAQRGCLCRDSFGSCMLVKDQFFFKGAENVPDRSGCASLANFLVGGKVFSTCRGGVGHTIAGATYYLLEFSAWN